MSKKELDHLYLSKNERLGIIFLFVLLLIVIYVPKLYFNKEPIIVQSVQSFFPAKESTRVCLKEDSLSKFKSNPFQTKTKSTIELFPFDPNKIKENDAMRLGIPTKTFHSLQKYLSVGGKIKTKEKFHQIYGMDDATFQRLESYIRIEEPKHSQFTNSYQKKKTPSPIDINTAEAADLLTLPGIGEKLSNRIIKYRNKLGGFIDINQLHEVYGLQDSVIIKIQKYLNLKGSIKKINLNSIEFKDLIKHPYFDYQKARIIINYRMSHPPFKVIQDLSKITAIDSDWIQKISGYVEFE